MKKKEKFCGYLFGMNSQKFIPANVYTNKGNTNKLLKP